MTTLTVDEKTAAAFRTLQEKAQAKRVPVDAVLLDAAGRLDAHFDRSDDSIDAWFKELDEILEESPPDQALPKNFSRADIYDEPRQ